jgi:hypothetical protein
VVKVNVAVKHIDDMLISGSKISSVQRA